MKKMYVVNEFIGEVNARLTNTVLEVRASDIKGRFDLENAIDIDRLKNLSFSTENTQDQFEFKDLEEAKAAFNSCIVWTDKSDYCFCTLDEITLQKNGDEWSEISFNELDRKDGNEDFIRALREEIVENEMEEDYEFLTNIFGEDRIATKREIMEHMNLSCEPDEVYTWNEIIDMINSDTDVFYFIADEDFDFENDLDNEKWIAGSFWKIVDFETGKRQI